METAWFDPNLYAWIPGTLIGVYGGLLGALTGLSAPQAKRRGMVLGGWRVMEYLSVLLTLGGLYAAWSDQPYGVWYGLMLPGLVGIVVSYFLLPVVTRRYDAAEADHSSPET